jgi:hypothetical protein
VSRFDHARRASIAVWTGATVIWATTLVAVHVSESEGQLTPVPVTPASGLTILRTAGTVGASASTDMAAEGPAPDTIPAPPQPVSSGS